MNYKVGDVVMAVAGRDMNKLFIVYSMIDDNFVYIADGKTRSVESPKRKKVKHIKFIVSFDDINSDIKNKVVNGKFTNSIIRKLLSGYEAN